MRVRARLKVSETVRGVVCETVAVNVDVVEGRGSSGMTKVVALILARIVQTPFELGVQIH